MTDPTTLALASFFALGVIVGIVIGVAMNSIGDDRDRNR